MRFVWIETEKIERNDSIAYMGQVMLEMDDKSEKYIAAVRNNDADDTWTYTVHNRSLIDKNPKVDLETYETYQDFEAARNSTYGIYFLMCRLFVLAETDGLDEYNNQIVDDICDLYQNASDGKLVALLKRVPNGKVAVMRAAIKLDDAIYVQNYVSEFKNDEKGPGRFLEFNPSEKICKILQDNGGISEVTDWDIKEVRDKIREFKKERDWDKFHTPENLAKSIVIEAGELLECFQWNDKFDRQKVSEELSDVMMYCIMMADRANIDIKEEMLRKMAINAAKYPAKKARGNSLKYTEL